MTTTYDDTAAAIPMTVMTQTGEYQATLADALAIVENFEATRTEKQLRRERIRKDAMANQDFNADGIKQCSKCGKWKTQGKFNASSKANDGKQAWCRKCHKDYKATIGKKGLKIIEQLPSSAEYVDALLKELRANNVILRIRPADDSLAKQRKAVGPEFDKQWRWVDDYLKKQRMERIGAIIDAAFTKAETQARIDHAIATTARAKTRIAKAKEDQRKAIIKTNDAKNAAARQQRQLMKQIAEIESGIATVETNYNRAAEQVAKANANRLAKAEVVIDTAAHEWIVRAHATTDPDLKIAYLSNARDMVGVLADDE